MDERDQQLLDLLQTDFPLCPRPYAALGERTGLDEAQVLERVARLKQERIIRQVSAIFDSRRLGYQSTLAAFAAGADRLEEVAAGLTQHPGISHCYLREHRFNIWFTLTVPPEQDCRAEFERLQDELKPEAGLYVPVTRIFKIGVSFAMGADADALKDTTPDSVAPPTADPLDEADRQAVRQLQRDLPLCPEPFAELAAEISLDVEELLRRARDFLEAGTMRRFAAVLHHRTAGYSANGMACWVVPEAQGLEFGRRAAAFADVSHCYERIAYPPEWPYSFFTMIHCRSEDEVRSVAAEISAATGVEDYLVLFSTREFKKQRVKYFV